MICVSVGRSRVKSLREEHQKLADAGAELVELRLDYLRGTPDVDGLLANRPTPVVVTCRRPEDRGRWRGDEKQRQIALRAAILGGADYVDLEDGVAGSIPRYGETKRIVSFHDFEGTPHDLDAIHKRLVEQDADVVKIVTTADGMRDCLRVLDLVHRAEVPTVGFCMGDFGTVSRLLCGRFGSPFTYATFSSERELAPGQISFQLMRDLYRYDSIDRSTELYGVIGDPIGHSMSPLLHNTALQKAGRNAAYLPLRVSPGDLSTAIKVFEKLGFRGLSVTIPHKQAVLEAATASDSLVKRIGAANTLTLVAPGSWSASNTDYKAALDCIARGLARTGDSDFAGKSALILGAGGVSRAIAAGLLERGAKVAITNRTAERAKQVAKELGCTALLWEQRATVEIDILVNGTPVGMHPDVDETPFPGNWLRERTVVFDTIYNPERTLLIKEAGERGCITETGLKMFVGQAAAQYELFTEDRAPLETIEETLRRTLSPVRY